MATGLVSSGPNSSFFGIRSSLDVFSAQSNFIDLPVYALILPMIAHIVLSATRLPSLSPSPLRMLLIRSVCSCTYGLGEPPAL